MADSTQATKRRVEEILWSEGLLTEDQIRETLAEQRRSNLFLNEALVQLGYVTEEQIAGALSKRCNLPSLRAEQYEVSKDVLDVFPETMLREYQFIPLDRIGDVLILLGATLLDRDILREIQRLSGCQIYQYVGTWSDIRNAIDRLFKKKDGEGEDLTSLGKLLLSDGAAGEAPLPQPPSPQPPAQPSAPATETAPAPSKPRKGLLNLFRKK
jgi:MSHA biogenesis protein MshE